MAYLNPIQFANSNVLGTTLNGSIAAGDNSLTLTSQAVLGCPTSPSFDILIDNEYITVNGISGNVCTPLSRGAGGTTPAAHSSGAPVYAPITLGMLTAAMARVDQANLNGMQAPVFTFSGLYSQVATISRIVGAVAPGAGNSWTPVGGPYNVGDGVLDVSNAVYYACTVAGSPGTWVNGRVTLGSAAPQGLGTAAAGNATAASHENHVHPTTTTGSFDTATAVAMQLGPTNATMIQVRGPKKQLLVGQTLTVLGTGSATLTAAQLLGGIIEHPITGTATDTVDTGANLDAAIANVANGDSFVCTVINTGSSSSIQFAGNTGVTLKGNSSGFLNINKVAYLVFIRTGSATWTCYASF